MTPREYLTLRERIIAAGFEHDVAWAETVRAPLTASAFADEYIWVVLNSGMKNTVACTIADRVYPTIQAGGSARDVFRHPGKAAAIDHVWMLRHCFFARFQMVKADPTAIVAFCRTLPWIGAITCWHLAKNYGADVAKPDRWLVRVAERSGETVDGLCRRLSADTGDRIGTVDLVIWRSCTLWGLPGEQRSGAA